MRDLKRRLEKIEQTRRVPIIHPSPDLSRLEAGELDRFDEIVERALHRLPLTDDDLAFLDEVDGRLTWTDGLVLSAEQQRAAFAAYFRADR